MPPARSTVLRRPAAASAKSKVKKKPSLWLVLDLLYRFLSWRHGRTSPGRRGGWTRAISRNGSDIPVVAPPKLWRKKSPQAQRRRTCTETHDICERRGSGTPRNKLIYMTSGFCNVFLCPSEPLGSCLRAALLSQDEKHRTYSWSEIVRGMVLMWIRVSASGPFCYLRIPDPPT